MKLPNLGLISLVLLVGCGKEQPSSYEAPKEQMIAPMPEQMGLSMGSDADVEAVRAAHAAMAAEAPDAGFSADLPEGWTEQPGTGMREAIYMIEGTSIDFYLISLSMGDLPSNVNRWRGQVGLSDAPADEIAKEVATFQISGHEVSYIEIYNEEGGKGIIAAIVDLSPKYWYFTAKGTVDELKANASDIKAFLESIKMNGIDLP